MRDWEGNHKQYREIKKWENSLEIKMTDNIDLELHET